MVSKFFPINFILVTQFSSPCSTPKNEEIDDNVIVIKNLLDLLS